MASKHSNRKESAMSTAKSNFMSASALLMSSPINISSADKLLIAACQQLAAEGLADHFPETDRAVKLPERFKANRRTLEVLSDFR